MAVDKFKKIYRGSRARFVHELRAQVRRKKEDKNENEKEKGRKERGSKEGKER